MMKKLLASLTASLVMCAGCTAPGLQGVLPYQIEMDEARQTIARGHLPPPRNVPQAQLETTLARVARRIGPAVRETCRITKAINCNATGLDRISLVQDPSINAFVDGEHRIGVHSGLVQQAASDDEIAAVLAHEYGHILAGHIDRKAENQGQGMLAGALIGLVIAAETGVNNTDEWMELGHSVGTSAYSQQFELEADYYMALILSNAGIDMDQGRNLLLRLARQSQGRSSGWGRSAALMANTHPANDWRIARWKGVTRTIADSKVVSPTGNDTELRLNAKQRIFAGNNGVIAVGNMARWINPRTGASGMVTLIEIAAVQACGKTCVKYNESVFGQNKSEFGIEYACWVPNGHPEFFGAKKPWGFLGRDKGACP